MLLFIRVDDSMDDSWQTGGWDDPYAWIRPWFIIDFFRNFWLTR
jgi:hypothetical protein